MSDTESQAGLSDIAAEFLAEDAAGSSQTPVGLNGEPPSKEVTEYLAKDSKHSAKTKASVKKGLEQSARGQTVISSEDFSDDDSILASETEDSETAEEEAPAPVKKELYELKVNGKVYKFDSVDKLKAAAQRGLAIQQKATDVDNEKRQVAQERAQLKQQVEFLQRQAEAMKNNPEQYLSKLPNMEAVAEKLLLQRAKEWELTQQMTPRELELYRREQAAAEKLQKYEAESKTRAEQEQERLVEEQKEALSQVMGAALEKHSLPKNTTTLRVMASIMRAHAMKGVQLTEAEAAQLTRHQLNQINKDSFGSMKAEDFVASHPELAEQVRKYYVQRAKAGLGQSQPTPAPRGEKGQFKPKAEPKDSWELELEQLKKRGKEENKKNGFTPPYHG